MSINTVTITYYKVFIALFYTFKSQCYLTLFLNKEYIKLAIRLKSLT